MFQPSNEVKEILINSGWFKGRSVNTDLYKKEALADGYVFYDNVNLFLSVFGELRIVFVKKGTDIEDFFHFKASQAISGINPIWVNEDIMMAADGTVYGGFDDKLYFIAESGDKAFQAIIEGEKFEEIP